MTHLNDVPSSSIVVLPIRSHKDTIQPKTKMCQSIEGLTKINIRRHAIVFENINYIIKSLTLDFSRVSSLQFPLFIKKTHILHNITGYIPKNCICAIIGQSGAGKTSLLGLLAGIPKSGSIHGKISVCSKKIVFVAQVSSCIFCSLE